MVVSLSTLAHRVRRGTRKLRSDSGEWLLLTGDRTVVAGLLTAAFALHTVGLATAGPVEASGDSGIIYLFRR